MSLLDQAHEAGSFGHEPAPRIAADDVRHEQRPRGRSDVRGARLDEGGRQPRHADVLVSQPGQAFLPHARRLGLGQALLGEGPQQVMQPVPDQAGGVDPGDVGQHRVHQLLEQLLGVIGVRLEHRGQVPRREVRGEQAEHAEGPLLRLGPSVITEAERCTASQSIHDRAEPPPGTERPQPDRAVPLPLQPGHELAQVERDRHLKFPDNGGMPPFRARAEHCLPQNAQRIARCERGLCFLAGETARPSSIITCPSGEQFSRRRPARSGAEAHCRAPWLGPGR